MLRVMLLGVSGATVRAREASPERLDPGTWRDDDGLGRPRCSEQRRLDFGACQGCFYEVKGMTVRRW